MGTVNGSGDMVPPNAMYEAVRMAGVQVRRTGELAWDFSRLLTAEPPAKFEAAVHSYVDRVLAHPGDTPRGWKLPETVLAIQWIAQMFPEAYFVHWTRDPRDALLGGHMTDQLADWNVPSACHQNVNDARVESWVYQRAIVDATPPPARTLTVRFEDFVLRQDAERQRMAEFLGMPIAPVQVDSAKVGGSRRGGGPQTAPVPDVILARYGYAQGKE